MDQYAEGVIDLREDWLLKPAHGYAPRRDTQGVTPLVDVCYRLMPVAVGRLLESGADPNEQADYGGGVTPALATFLGVADAFDVGEPHKRLMAAARRSIEIWALLQAQGGSCGLPPNILVGRGVLRLLQEAAGNLGETFLLVSLVRAEERMHSRER